MTPRQYCVRCECSAAEIRIRVRSLHQKHEAYVHCMICGYSREVECGAT